jgi:hypothetical protein
MEEKINPTKVKSWPKLNDIYLEGSAMQVAASFFICFAAADLLTFPA